MTDHRILRTPESRSEGSVARGSQGPPLVLLNGDDLRPREIDSLTQELGIALTFEAGLQEDPAQQKRLGYLAFALLDKARAGRPEDLIARRMRARAMALEGRYRDAIRLDEGVLESAGSFEQVLDDCVLHAIEAGEIRAAVAPAKRAVALNPFSAMLHERLGYVDLQVQDWSGALSESREALRLNPFLRFARMFVAECLLHQHDRKGGGGGV